MYSSLTKALRTVFLLFIALSAHAAVVDNYNFSSAEEQARFLRLSTELRCPKCQNQSIADSNSPIAEDLRREVHRMVNSGSGDAEIIDFMLERYGDFVLYKPRLKPETFLLWFGPVILLLLGLLVMVRLVRKHQPTAEDLTLNDEELAELEKVLGERR